MLLSKYNHANPKGGGRLQNLKVLWLVSQLLSCHAS